MKKKMNLSAIRTTGKYLFVSLVPLFCVLMLLLVNGEGINTKILMPVWNDEVGWWSQIHSMIKYGKPLGYYGYNGTHAQIGTFGAWGIAPLIPYALFGKLFGWTYYSMAYANICFLCMAVFTFCLLTKPSNTQIYCMILFYVCMPITIGYSMTSMAEGERYALAIILAGIIVWISKKTENIRWNCKSILQLIFIALFCLYAIMVYLVFALVVPVICWYIFCKKKKIIRVTVGIIATLVISYVENWVVGMTCAPYTVSTIQTIINIIKEEGIYQGICYMLENFFSNATTISLYSVIHQQDQMLQVYYSICWVMGIGLLIRMVKKLRENHMVEKFDVLALYFLVGFIVGYCLLYTGESWTLCRGTNTGVLMAGMFLCMKEKKIDRVIIRHAIWIMICGISVWNYFHSLVAERCLTYERVEIIEQEKNVLENVIAISEANEPWENTIANYGRVDNMYLALPTGSGGNYMLNGSTNENARYAIVENIGIIEENQGTVYMLEENGHELIWEDDYFWVLRRYE